jgi:hypothetical protein
LLNTNFFLSLLLRRECCSFSNGEYVKSGLAELEKWIVVATEEVKMSFTCQVVATEVKINSLCV